MDYLPHEIRQAITTRIAALTPTDGYSTGRTGYAHSAADAWREAQEPLVPEWEPAYRGHLSFFVDDRDILDTGEYRTGPEPGLVGAPLTIRFMYEMRARNKIADWDGAAKAAAHLLFWLLDEGWQTSVVIRADSRPISRIPIGNGEWLAVEVRISALYQLALCEAA